MLHAQTVATLISNWCIVLERYQKSLSVHRILDCGNLSAQRALTVLGHPQRLTLVGDMGLDPTNFVWSIRKD